MSPKKLSDDDRENIIKLYRTSTETTASLAKLYGVSSSTISRFLKNSLSEAEYESLIQQKRLTSRAQPETEFPERPEELVATVANPDVPLAPSLAPQTPLQTLPEEEDSNLEVDVKTFNEMYGEDLEPEEDDEDEEWEDEPEPVQIHPVTVPHDLKVLPLSEAFFPRVCYIVIDRCAELITKPLKDFSELGNIPSTEVQQKTLPVFDNQKVARRFSNRSQRVIKVPDGRIFKKTSPYLRAKGITRLLIDGQVYALPYL